MSDLFNSLHKSMQEFIEYEKGNKQLTVRDVTILPIEEWSAQAIKNLRESYSISQTVFSFLLGVSNKTVEAWEAGKNVPSGPSLRLLQLFKNRPDLIKSMYTYRSK